MLELIMVMVIAGILSAVAVPKFSETTSFNRRGFHDQTLAMLRFAQKSAIAQRRTVCVTFNSTTSANLMIASVANSSTCDTDLIDPNTESSTYTIGTDKFDVNYDSLPTNFNFDALGQPSPDQLYTVQIIGLDQHITIEKNTGYIHE